MNKAFKAYVKTYFISSVVIDCDSNHFSKKDTISIGGSLCYVLRVLGKHELMVGVRVR